MKCGANFQKWLWCVILMLLSACTSAAGEIIYVDDDGPADFNTIQAAIDDANDGDVVIVMPGTYTGNNNRDIDFKGKAITLRSEAGPETCIIDCNGTEQDPHRGFYFHNGEDANSILQGFSVTNGYTLEDGGAIYCNMSSPLIIDCIIFNNKAHRSRVKGGGIALVESEANIVSCVVRNNIAQPGDGGGIYISNNSGQNPYITRCIISGNTAIAHPRFGGEGGGIALFGNGCIINCVITGNRAGYWGGGISCRMPFHQGLLCNSIVWSNICPIRSEASQLTMPTCNYDGIFALTVENSTIADCNGNDGIYIMAHHYYCLTGAWLTIDPLFSQPGYWEIIGTPDFLFGAGDDDIWIDGDYHLKSRAGRWDPVIESWVKDDITSPCIDAGDPNIPIGWETHPHGGIINMGAYGGTLEASRSMASLPSWQERYNELLASREPETAPLRFAYKVRGYLHAISLGSDGHFVVAGADNLSADQIVLRFFEQWKDVFMVNSGATELIVTKTTLCPYGTIVRLKQTYAGLEVYGASAIVQVDLTGGVVYVICDMMTDPSSLEDHLDMLSPSLGADRAADLAVQVMSKEHPGWDYQASDVELKIFDVGVLGRSENPRLIWFMLVEPVGGGCGDWMAIDAHSGEVVYRTPTCWIR